VERGTVIEVIAGEYHVKHKLTAARKQSPPLPKASLNLQEWESEHRMR
jgi:hypothetical protein